jgi:phosphoenolpyruvate carboxykinase (ATP)
MSSDIDLGSYGINVSRVLRNPSPPRLYEDAILRDGAFITSTGALATNSGEKTGRSPKDKRIVKNPQSEEDIWWGNINIKIDEETFMRNRCRAIDYLNTRELVYVIDGFAGWDPKYRIKVRIVCERAYHALFMQNMLMRPSVEELAAFGEPDYVIFNAGKFFADPDQSPELGSPTCVSINFEQQEFVILGSQYAGEMKKGVFTIMNYLMPRKDVLSKHCSAKEVHQVDVSLFFGL